MRFYNENEIKKMSKVEQSKRLDMGIVELLEIIEEFLPKEIKEDRHSDFRKKSLEIQTLSYLNVDTIQSIDRYSTMLSENLKSIY